MTSIAEQIMINRRKRAQMKQDLEKAGEYKKPRYGEQIIREGFQKGYQRGVKSYKTGAEEKRFTTNVRKAVHLVAPKGSLVKAITQQKKKKGSRGRGRPSGTYKVRYLPLSGRAVKVPTHVYKKMLSAEKAQMRLAKAQQMAQVQAQADQLAMQTDSRYQSGSEDQFLAEPDQQHEMEVARVQQMQQLQRVQQPRQQPISNNILTATKRQNLLKAQQPPQRNVVDDYANRNRITLMEGNPRAPRLKFWKA